MAIGEIRQGQILPLIFVVRDQDDNLVNLAAASSRVIVLITANNGVKQFDAQLHTDGSDGKMQYITKNESGQVDLDNNGDYKAQAFAVIGGIEYPSDIIEFHVFPNLK